MAAVRSLDAIVKDKLRDVAKDMEDLYARSIKKIVKELEEGQLVLIRRARVTRL